MPEKSKKRLYDILYGDQLQKYHLSAGISISKKVADEFSDINSNILDLLNASEVIKENETVLFLRYDTLPFTSAVIMSATASPEIYRNMLNRDIYVYSCKQAAYMGNIVQYTNSTYSRNKLTVDEGSEELIKRVHEFVGDYEVITFACIEEEFNTKYHFGGIEGLDCLSGKNIAVIGLPNVDEKVYKLFGMFMGIDTEKENMKFTEVTYNGYQFYLNTFDDPRLREV